MGGVSVIFLFVGMYTILKLMQCIFNSIEKEITMSEDFFSPLN